MTPRAVAFDFNGTLSDDEWLLFEIYAEMFAERGKPLTQAEYLDQLAGLSEDEIIRSWLGHVDAALVEERVTRYTARAADGSTVSEEARAAVRYAAARVPVAIVSSAFRSEIETVVAGAGLEFSTIVTAEDVARHKPDPEAYVLAAARLGVAPEELLVFEDTEAGVASAKAAGATVVAIVRTLGADRLAAADAFAETLDVERFLQ
jgi:beta-phosphoglucomutase